MKDTMISEMMDAKHDCKCDTRRIDYMRNESQFMDDLIAPLCSIAEKVHTLFTAATTLTFQIFTAAVTLTLKTHTNRRPNTSVANLHVLIQPTNMLTTLTF